jgi:hypothetical protein
MNWKKINDWDYSINEAGEVRNNKSGRILRPAPDGDGYMRVALCKNGKQNTYKIHRLLGVYFLDCPPHLFMDHIDGDRKNNALSNLRVVTHQHNHFNRTTAKGYTWNIQMNKWQAVLSVSGKNKSLGYYDTKEEARAAYLEGKKIYHVIPDAKPQ